MISCESGFQADMTGAALVTAEPPDAKHDDSMMNGPLATLEGKVITLGKNWRLDTD